MVQFIQQTLKLIYKFEIKIIINLPSHFRLPVQSTFSFHLVLELSENKKVDLLKTIA